MLEPLSLCTCHLAASRVVIVVSLLGNERFDVGMLGQERLSLLSPGSGEIPKGLLDLVCLNNSRFGQSLCVSSKRALVDGLGLLADAPCFVQALLKLAARGGDAVVERQVAGSHLTRTPAQLLDLAD